jgi:mannose-6-phosphate isomerase-like protein (cupin superfamily)
VNSGGAGILKGAPGVNARHGRKIDRRLEEAGMTADWMFSLKDLRAGLPTDPQAKRANYPLLHGSLKAGIYAPDAVDRQSPHSQDELYIIASGTGVFVKGDERRPFAPQDLIFVEAGVVHRFENFSSDFTAWVIFWGPEGGEG